jgi:hypothetical protein
MGSVNETCLGPGCPGMPSLPGAHANFSCDSSSRRHAKNSRVCWSSVTRTACGASRLQSPCRIALVLNSAEKPAPDTCAPRPVQVQLESPARPDSGLNPLCAGPFLDEIPPPHSRSLHKTRYRTFRWSATFCLKLLSVNQNAWRPKLTWPNIRFGSMKWKFKPRTSVSGR